MADRIFLGVDIGGTKTRVAAVTDDNVVIAMGEEATGDIGGADPGLSRSLALARRLAGTRARVAGAPLAGGAPDRDRTRGGGPAP